jgi:TolB protein
VVPILDYVDTPISFSPDGKHFSFVRRNPEKGESLLVIASADGAHERVIARRNYPQDFGGDDSAPAWSPDGKIIAIGVGENALNNMTLVGVDAESGRQTQLTSRRWLRVGQLAWMPDARGVVMLSTVGSQFTYQVWYLSYPAGEVQQISNDLNNYQSVSLTADGKRLVTVQAFAVSNIWVMPTGRPFAPNR